MKLGTRKLRNAITHGRLTICVIGLGRFGLSTACLFASKGAKVIGADDDRGTVRLVNKGKAPFKEPGLGEARRRGGKRLRAMLKVEEAVRWGDVIIVHVPVTVDQNRKPDYSALEGTARAIGLSLKPYSLVIVASTVGPGVTDRIVRGNIQKYSGLTAGGDFGMAYSPVRAASGTVLHDLVNCPRIVGAYDEHSLKTARVVLSVITKGRIVETRDILTAEIAKLFENVYRDVNIALANELAIFCKEYGADYDEAHRSANTHPSCHLHYPGNVGGISIPVDPYLLLSEAKDSGINLRIIGTARKTSNAMLWHSISLVNRAMRESGKRLAGRRVLVLGVSYKPDVKDVEGSRVSDLITLLEGRGVKVIVYDPLFTPRELNKMGYSTRRRLADAARGADCVVVATGHSKFRRLGLRALKRQLKDPPIIVDLGRVIDPERARIVGFTYYGLGYGIPPQA